MVPQTSNFSSTWKLVRYINQKVWGWGPVICVLTSPHTYLKGASYNSNFSGSQRGEDRAGHSVGSVVSGWAHLSHPLGGSPLPEPALDLYFGRRIILLWDSDLILVKCSNGRYLDLWLILYAMKTKVFSIAFITFLYRAGWGVQGRKGTKGPETGWIPPITISHL